MVVIIEKHAKPHKSKRGRPLAPGELGFKKFKRRYDKKYRPLTPNGEKVRIVAFRDSKGRLLPGSNLGNCFARFSGPNKTSFKKGYNAQDKHRKWKGDAIFSESRGVMVKNPEGVGRITRARFLYEKKYGKLPKDKLVIHLDGNKFNDDLSNLTAMTRAEWMKKIRKLKKPENHYRIPPPPRKKGRRVRRKALFGIKTKLTKEMDFPLVTCQLPGCRNKIPENRKFYDTCCEEHQKMLLKLSHIYRTLFYIPLINIKRYETKRDKFKKLQKRKRAEFKARRNKST